MIYSRLANPQEIELGKISMSDLQDKISSCMTGLFFKPENGGNPFLFAYAAPKPHELAVVWHGQKIPTAATNGRNYLWNPKFLDSLLSREVTTVMEHEGWHVILDHPVRGVGRMNSVWNIAVDYVANSIIWKMRQDNGQPCPFGVPNGPNIGEPLSYVDLIAFIDGKPNNLPDGIKNCYADMAVYGKSPESMYDEIIDHWNKSPRKCPICGRLTKKMPGDKDRSKKNGKKDKKDKNSDKSDESQESGRESQDNADGNNSGGQSPNEDDGKCKKCGKNKKNNGKGNDKGEGNNGEGKANEPNVEGQGKGDDNTCTCSDGDGEGEECECGKDCGSEGGCECPGCGADGDWDPMGSMDSHIECEMNRQEVQTDLMRAADQTNSIQGRGLVPSEVEEIIGELKKPTVKFTDLVRNCFFRKILNDGLKNNWKRLRRRHLSTNPKQYLPTRFQCVSKWLSLIDQSGSMSNEDIATGLSQLQVLGHNTDGYIVNCDCQVDWTSVVKIKSATVSQIQNRVKRSRSGGTDFTEFFRDYPQKLGNDFDVIIILTDGDCGTVPIELKPKHSDVVWVLTRKQPADWSQPFGRVVQLKEDRV
jgi:predicted metal-dependent peptidase